MKGTILGIRYDTEKAILIGEATFGQPGLPSSWQASLYVSPYQAHYFLVGSGGMMTRFSNTRKRFHAISQKEAVFWARIYLPDTWKDHIVD